MVLIVKVCVQMSCNQIRCGLSWHKLTAVNCMKALASCVEVAGGMYVTLLMCSYYTIPPSCLRCIMCSMIKALGILFRYL